MSESVRIATTSSSFNDAMVKQLYFERIMAMRPDELIAGLKVAGVRSRWADVDLPPLATLDGFKHHTARKVLLGLRKQLDQFLVDQEQCVRRRVRYFFQCQLLGKEQRKALGHWGAFTFLPGGSHDAFPAGTRFWDLERLEVASVGIRTDRPRGPQNRRLTTHFDFRVLAVELDRTTGEISLGGTSNDNRSRVKAAYSLAFEPGSHLLAIPEDRVVSWFDQAIEMFECLELAEASKSVGQFVPKFPRVHLGFDKSELLNPEQGDGVKAEALQSVQAWLRAGAPMTDTPAWPWATLLHGSLSSFPADLIHGWDQVAQINAEDANTILLHIWLRGCCDHDGLSLVPANFFTQSTTQLPYKRARRIFVDVADFLGRKTRGFNNKVEVRGDQAAIQRLRLVESETPAVGSVGSWRYYFGGSPAGQESLFA